MKLRTSFFIRNGGRGFTLTELLTVIAIIAVLVAIFFPILGKVRTGARDAQCKSNLRQIGVGMLMYVGEHKGELPYNKNDPSNMWRHLVKAYTPNPADLSVWWCPEEPREIPAGKWTEDPTFTPSTYNVYYNWKYWPSVNGKLGFKPIMMNQLPNPATDSVLREGNVSTTARYYSYDNAGINYTRHSHANILYFDGHVKSVAP